MKIYKYFSAGVLELVFGRAGLCGIKCALPQDYNDPYELFLGVDLSVTPELLAAYREIIQDIPQRPTSCFSKSPSVTPMWAHYANNHSGFVVEFDTVALKAAFPDLLIRDVVYRSEPNDSIAEHLQIAVGTRKPRHAYFLQQVVLSSAYFSKDVAWSYEQECRLLDQEDYCERVDNNLILQVPIACCSSIIAGKNMVGATLARSQQIAAAAGLRWFQAVIGKSSAEPFMIASNGTRAIFDAENAIVTAAKVCERCAEPIAPTERFCPWCSITEAHAINAARGNPLRMLDNHGMLEDYYKGLAGIARGSKGDS